jgi:hypothetical protein
VRTREASQAYRMRTSCVDPVTDGEKGDVMDGSTVPTVMGVHCDHRGCTAPVRVTARFTSGELSFCMHHWVSLEELAVASPAYLHAVPAGRELAEVPA